MNASLRMQKSACVTPLKITTIPRLGLTVATVSAKVGVMLQEEFNYTNLKQYFCTDSKEVPLLGCIDNDTKRFHMFVANRVQMIRSSTDAKQRQHIDTKNNPADHNSRGSSAEELMRSNWLTGPAFFEGKKSRPLKKRFQIIIRIGDSEVKATVHTTVVKESFNLID